MSNEEITVGYWTTKALGSSLRMLVIYSGRPLRAKLYKLKATLENNSVAFDGSDWHQNDKPILKKKNSLINLPYVEIYNEKNEKIIISQSLACLSFLGKKLNMFGKNELEEMYCSQLLSETSDLRNLIGKFSYTKFIDRSDELNESIQLIEKIINKNNGNLLKFEEWFEQKENSHTNIFLVGNSISAPDFSLFDILDFLNEFVNHYNFSNNYKEDIYEYLNFPKLSRFYKEFKNLPKMQKYFNSLLYELPYQNKSALFSSKNKKKIWDPSTDVDKFPDKILIS